MDALEAEGIHEKAPNSSHRFKPKHEQIDSHIAALVPDSSDTALGLVILGPAAKEVQDLGERKKRNKTIIDCVRTVLFLEGTRCPGVR